MDASLSGYVGLAVMVIVAVGAVFASRVLFGKKRLPPFPEFGALPLAELEKYYAAGEPPIAWEKVRGWDLNETPPGLNAPAPIDHIVLMPRLLEFCSGKSGKLQLVFNFLVAAIERVEFDASPAGTLPPGIGLIRIYTPSGETLVLASPAFAQALEQAVARGEVVS